MNSSFTVHLEERSHPAAVPLSAQMRRFVFESLVTSAALLAIGGFIILTGGDLGSVSTTLHAGRICLALSLSISIATGLVAAVASRRWPGWEMPSSSIRLLAASVLLTLVGYYAYGSQTGRALLALATGGALAAITFYKCTSKQPAIDLPSPQQDLADILNETVGNFHHLSIVFDESEALPNNLANLPISEAVDRLLLHDEYKMALKLCIDDFYNHLLDIGTIFLVQAFHHLDYDSYQQLIDSVEQQVDHDQRTSLHWIALLCRGWVTSDFTYLSIADAIARPLCKEHRDQLLEATAQYRISNAIQELEQQLTTFCQRAEDISCTDSTCEQRDEIENQGAEWINNSLLHFVFRVLYTEATDLSYVRKLVHMLFYQVELFRPYILKPEELQD